jgi:hypothetical protein
VKVEKDLKTGVLFLQKKCQRGAISGRSAVEDFPLMLHWISAQV